MLLNVLYSPPYFSLVMHKCCIGTLEVSRLMCSTRLRGVRCFNNIVYKSISSLETHFCVLFCHIGLQRSTELRENCYFITK